MYLLRRKQIYVFLTKAHFKKRLSNFKTKLQFTQARFNLFIKNGCIMDINDLLSYFLFLHVNFACKTKCYTSYLLLFTFWQHFLSVLCRYKTAQDMFTFWSSNVQSGRKPPSIPWLMFQKTFVSSVKTVAIFSASAVKFMMTSCISITN